MQSLAYFAVLAWLPAFLRDHGVGAGQAGLALSLYNLFGVVAALLVPTIAGRQTDQRALALTICAAWAAGVIGLLVAPGGYLAWTVIAGLAQGASIRARAGADRAAGADAGHRPVAVRHRPVGWVSDRRDGSIPARRTARRDRVVDRSAARSARCDRGDGGRRVGRRPGSSGGVRT
jgi:MFS family permease